MNDVAFLSYFPDPFDVKNSRYFVLRSDGSCNELSGRDVSDYRGTLVSYETHALIDDMRRGGVNPPLQLINIDDAIRLQVGRARNEGGERLWNLWRNLSPHFGSSDLANAFEQIVRSKAQRPEGGDIAALLDQGAQALGGLWVELLGKLREQGELDRFIRVDVPVQQIFHHRQARGISVDKDAATELLRHVANEKYLAYSKVAEKLGRSPTGLGFWSIQPHLSKTDAADLAEEQDGGRLRELFKMAAVRSEFARDYLSYADADRDESVLRRSSATGGRIYPEFQPHGTVTGRILVSDPYLQQLRRKYRRIFIADPGRRLVYLDYSQFEPGILAFLSGDENLVTAYNAGDLYEALSVAICGSVDRRPLSKRIFLAYSYGMTPERIAGLLLGEGEHASRAKMEAAIQGFFAAYPGLVAYRESTKKELLETGYAASLFGNRRWRATSGPLARKEMRWALNQPVQATASLIFKEALGLLAERFGSDAIVLPMHDAVLMQLPLDGFAEHTQEASVLLLQAYARRCPTIQPRVTSGPFADA